MSWLIWMFCGTKKKFKVREKFRKIMEASAGGTNALPASRTPSSSRLARHFSPKMNANLSAQLPIWAKTTTALTVQIKFSISDESLGAFLDAMTRLAHWTVELWCCWSAIKINRSAFLVNCEKDEQQRSRIFFTHQHNERFTDCWVHEHNHRRYSALWIERYDWPNRHSQLTIVNLNFRCSFRRGGLRCGRLRLPDVLRSSWPRSNSFAAQAARWRR